MFAERTAWSMDPNALTVALEQEKQAGADILDLTESNPTRCGFDVAGEKLLGPLSVPANLSYQPCSQGLRTAREALCRSFLQRGVKVAPENIFLTASTSEAYSFVFRLLANPGETVLFPQPSYPLFQFLADILDVRLEPYPLRYDGKHWNMDLDILSRKASSAARAIVCVNPNNPTGNYVRKDQLHLLDDVCRCFDMALISDEVFYDYCFETAGRASLLGHPRTLTFTLGGLSKDLGLPQMKLSWIVLSGPEDQVREARRRLDVIADTYLSVNTPVQNALEAWLTLKPDIQRQITERIVSNRAYLEASAQAAGLGIYPAEGGWYGVLQLPPGKSEEEWVLTLLERGHVLAHPGYFFDFEEEPVLVISFLPLPDHFRVGVDRILALAATGGARVNGDAVS
ncbi:MAG TPA: pyridoxal phosphate-dependent aminotransferase [Candidatus Omnitrophota bacterium]|nr:pyridoxal phosphate-dependent aminotransferase [Candidatus Omnitrophota bacterium]HPN56101.1 pyridoxal phosphate-dependent aminotransferase [Candidatus Omnitrophota bacterium]